MKNFKLVLGAAVIAASFASCKDEAKVTAVKHVDHYVVFVDSINSLDAQERAANWAAIQAEYETRTQEAEAALATLENEAKAQERINESKSKYEGVKAQAETDAKAAMEATANAAGGSMADSFFGPGNVVGNDMAFAWVNKDNLLSVYQKFVDTFNANHDSYSRQDFDKIKAWYEALDARKNTVEKEGLSAEDNRKIAALKLEFAPKFKWERMTAKGDENQDAKDAAN